MTNIALVQYGARVYLGGGLLNGATDYLALLRYGATDYIEGYF